MQFLDHQTGPPFRTEIPFTRFHWEAYVVATHFPLARGWERQLDSKDNAIFYGGHLTAASYERWLHQNAVRFVAAPDAELDYSAKAEMTLIDRGLPYLHEVMHSRHWRVYQVADATPIVAGSRDPADARPGLADDCRPPGRHPGGPRPFHALLGAIGRIGMRRAGRPYTRMTLRAPGTVRLVTSFALDRITQTRRDATEALRGAEWCGAQGAYKAKMSRSSGDRYRVARRAIPGTSLVGSRAPNVPSKLNVVHS